MNTNVKKKILESKKNSCQEKAGKACIDFNNTTQTEKSTS